MQLELVSSSINRLEGYKFLNNAKEMETIFGVKMNLRA